MEHEELQEEIRTTEKIEKNERHAFGKGFFVGTVVTMAVAMTALVVFTNLFGKTLLIGPKAQSEGTRNILSSKVQKKVTELMGYINLYFYDEVNDEKLEEGIYSGLVSGLEDRYSEYYSAKEYEDLQITATQNYCGIGAALLQDVNTMQVTVSHVYEGSPAEIAGVKDGDRIVMVDEIDCTTMELTNLVTHIRGEEGTVVHLKIYREGEKDYIETDVTRANIDLPTIEHQLLEGKIGYIHILDFGAPTATQFEAAVEDLKKQGMQAMILDVRDNLGGMLNAVTGILDDILPEGVVVYTQDKYGNRQNFSSDEEKQMKYPLVVLMNEYSASASEILAGAIRDYEYGTLIGTTTFGKGVVQSVVPLKDGDAVKLTTAKYFTPKGENIHGTGIKPDIELEFEYAGDTTKEYDPMQDNQILKAIEVLSKELSN